MAPTPHNSAQMGDIAATVIMCGDPLRVEWIAESYLENPVKYNSVRGMSGFTGTYQSVRLSVQGHGMGVPSIGIYTHELYAFYGVERILRIGSAGGIQPTLQLGEIVLAQGVSTDSGWAAQYNLPGHFAPLGSFALLEKAVAQARAQGLTLHVGNLLTSDVFYSDPESLRRWAEMGVLAVEMEALGLYCNAARFGKQALCLATISDKPLTGEASSARQRQTGFGAMVRLALETAILP